MRALIICAVCGVASIYIYPTIGWMTLSNEAREERLEQWRQEDLELVKPTFWSNVTNGLNRWLQFDREKVINLGLDLQGGVHMVLGFEMTEEAVARGLDEADVQDMILERVRMRVNEFEAKEPVILKLGKNQVQVQLPGEKDVQRAVNLIMRMARLTFHIVSGPDEVSAILARVDRHFNNAFVPFLAWGASGRGVLEVPVENYARIHALAQEANETPGVMPEGKMLAFSAPPKPWEDRGYLIYVINSEFEMTGEGIKNAASRIDNNSPGNWQILFEFDSDSASQFADVTQQNIGRQLAILLDGYVVSAPTIQSRIYGSGQISGTFSQEESRDLAITLNSGSMPVPIREDYKGVVGASVGADSVNKGVRSSIVGLVLVMAFMVIYYRFGGLVANIALTVNALLVIGALAYFGATLTLPGIAGLILTIGMAVDANVLIFERIREELRNGKSLASSIEGGYARATTTILDANITTLIAAAVLTQFGTGPVQGFAITLSIGVCASVFAALVVTRAIMDFVTANKILTKLTMMSIIKAEPKFKFIAKRRMAAVLSLVVIAMGAGIFGYRGGEMFGVDFTEGTNMTVALNSSETIPEGRIRDQLTAAGFDAPSVQAFEEAGSTVPNQFVIRVSEVGEIQSQTDVRDDMPDTMSTRLQKALLPLTSNPTGVLDEEVELRRVETVGPAVGDQLRKDAIAAITYALMFIVLYLWFRFELKFAVGAVVALLHDVLVTLGVFALFGREITIPVVAAILTIIGYSLNDTIVVFDRVRENLRVYRGKGLTFGDIIDVSINQTLSRTILTSLTTLFVVMVLFLFGGSAINDFAFALIVGIIVGTYSSIFVASPVVYMWEIIRLRRLGSGGKSGSDRDGSSGRKRKKKSAGPKGATA